MKDIIREADEITHTVKGLNTAASVWLSAAVGVACGGGLYFAAAFTTGVLLVLLRFGPRHPKDLVGVDSDESIIGKIVAPQHDESITLLKSMQKKQARSFNKRKSQSKQTLNYD